MVSSDKLSEIKRRYRDDPNMYWVSDRLDRHHVPL
jgi:hypothetical protein